MDPDEDLHLYHQHRREFRFDLSRIPVGETLTAAEFRIYKDFVHERYENETFRVSVFQVLRQQPKRYVIIKYIRKNNCIWPFSPCHCQEHSLFNCAWFNSAWYFKMQSTATSFKLLSFSTDFTNPFSTPPLQLSVLLWNVTLTFMIQSVINVWYHVLFFHWKSVLL